MRLSACDIPDGLTPRQLSVLRDLAAAHARADWDEAEIAAEGLSVYRGDYRLSYRTLRALVQLTLVSCESGTGDGAFARYPVNGTGLLVAADPALAVDVADALRHAVPFSPTADGIEFLAEWPVEPGWYLFRDGSIGQATELRGRGRNRNVPVFQFGTWRYPSPRYFRAECRWPWAFETAAAAIEAAALRARLMEEACADDRDRPAVGPDGAARRPARRGRAGSIA